MSEIFIEVKAYVGENIENICDAAVTLANRLDIDVWFEFNGLQCLVRPHDSASVLMRAIREALSGGTPKRFVSSGG